MLSKEGRHALDMTAFREPTTARDPQAARWRRHDLIVPLAAFCPVVVALLADWLLDRDSLGFEPGPWPLAFGLGLGGFVAAGAWFLLRQRATLAWRESRFRDFAEAGSHWFWEMGPDLRFTWLSDNIRGYTGVGPEWYIGKRRQDLGVVRLDLPDWGEHLQLLERRLPFDGFVYELLGPDGSRQWARTSGRPMFDAAGRFLGYRGASTLCSKEMQALERAHQAEARLRAALAAMSDGFALYDADDRLLLCNEAYRTILPDLPAETLALGATFEAVIRALAERLPEAAGRAEAWVKQRMAQHRRSAGPVFRSLPDGRHFRVVERRVDDGGTVVLLTEVTELHRREQAVAESEARYVLAFKGADEGVWDWDIETGELYGSERLWQLIGLDGPSGFRRGPAFYDMILPEDRPAYRKLLSRHLRGELPTYEGQFRVRLPHGTVRWLRSRGQAIRNASGRAVRMTGSAADITEAKAAEVRLQRSEADLKAILDSARQAFLLLDPDGRVRAINRAGREATRRMIGAVVEPGMRIIDLVPETERAPLAAGIRRALDGATITREHQATVSGGDRIWLDITYTPVRRADGAIDGVCWTVTDVTERRRALAALAQSEERFRSVVEHAQDVFFIVGADGVLRYVSESVRRILGYEPAAMIGRISGRNTHPEDLPRAAEMMRQIGRTPDATATTEMRFRRADGIWRLFEIYAVNRLQDPAIGGILITARDVTERRAAEAELRAAKEQAEAASRAKSNFLATVSHELRTPLNAIIGFSEIMRDGLFGPLPERYHGYAEDVNDSGTHLLALINDILDVSKAEAGKLELIEAPFAVEAALEDCLRLVRDRAAESGLELLLSLAPGLRRLNGEERKVKQLVLNLLSNAVKFTERGGRVELAAAPATGGGLAIRVSDTGIGIAAENVPKALAAFGQVDSALSRKYVGTGLGLTLVQAFAQLHGAAFKLDSGLGRGTTVTITFPPERLTD